MKWFWLSFADAALPEGEQFLGVVVLPVDEQVTELIDYFDQTDTIDTLKEEDVPFYVAVQYSHFLGLNPGGEVQGYEITENIEKVPKKMRARLLTAEEIAQAGL